MIEELLIRDLGVIGEVTLSFAPGLNVLSGETGAGKTMVVSALQLLLGARADTDLVRAGAHAAVVDGCLRPAPAEAAEWLSDGDEELVVSREVGTSRSRARLAGRLASASALADVLGGAVAVHGQADSARLEAAPVQRALLDRSGDADLAAAADAYAAVYTRWRAAVDELADLRMDERDRAREIDRLRFELDEIDAVGPQPGEEEPLDAELRRLEHAESLTQAAAAAAAAIAEDAGARDTLGAGVAALRAVRDLDEELDALAQRVEGLAAEAQEVAMELRSYGESIEPDPSRLEELRERRAALGRLTRKYGPDAKAVAGYAEEARGRLLGLEGSGARVASLEQQVGDLQTQVRAAAQALTDARTAAGGRLSAAVEHHLAELAMEQARMEVRLTPAEPAAHGADHVEFLLAANVGEPALPLGKAASGGERSRVALAVRLALAEADDTPVMVFDEIDAGIGGQVARAVGEKLARLARGRQVLCVTHLAQLAAYADAHFVVRKTEHDGRTVAGVQRVDEEERVTELARMLAGDPGSAPAVEHAAALRRDALASLSARLPSAGGPVVH